MITATALWSAKEDEKFRHKFRHETQRHEVAQWYHPGASDAYYRARLKDSAEAQELLAGLTAHQSGLQQQVDAAVARHAELTAPLQEKLSGNLTPQERVTARAAVNKANGDLEQALASLKEQITATEDEIQFVRVRAGAKTQIENAAVVSGTVADQERQRTLKLAISELETFLLDKFERKYREADELAAKYKDEERASLARVYAGVVSLLTTARNTWVQEQNAIRARRLRELYATE